MVAEAAEVELIVVLVMMNLIVKVVEIIGMKKIVEEMTDMAVEDSTNVVEDNIVEKFGIHKHSLANVEKVDFEFVEEAKPPKT